MHCIPMALRRLLPAFLAGVLLVACTAHPTSMTNHAALSHDVYFSLKDATPEARQQLVSQCHDRLAGIDGIVFFAAGTRDPELDRDVNDQAYDVSLHVFFASRAAHDAYQTDPAHLAFIDANKDSWSGVRVFDSNLTAP